MKIRVFSLLFMAILVGTVSCLAQETSKQISPNAKIFISPMKDDFEKFLIAAFVSKKVPLEVVGEREKADFELTGTSDSKKAGAAKMIILGSWHSSEQASVTVVNLRVAWRSGLIQ